MKDNKKKFIKILFNIYKMKKINCIFKSKENQDAEKV